MRLACGNYFSKPEATMQVVEFTRMVVDAIHSNHRSMGFTQLQQPSSKEFAVGHRNHGNRLLCCTYTVIQQQSSVSAVAVFGVTHGRQGQQRVSQSCHENQSKKCQSAICQGPLHLG